MFDIPVTASQAAIETIFEILNDRSQQSTYISLPNIIAREDGGCAEADFLKLSFLNSIPLIKPYPASSMTMKAAPDGRHVGKQTAVWRNSTHHQPKNGLRQSN